MKIVLDTNVLVAGLLSPFGPCAEIVRMVSSGELTLYLDARILSEYDSKSCGVPSSGSGSTGCRSSGPYRTQGIIVASSPLSDPLPDPEAIHFLKSPLPARPRASSGNHAHFPAEQCQGVKTLSPSGSWPSTRSSRSDPIIKIDMRLIREVPSKLSRPAGGLDWPRSRFRGWS